MAQYTVAMQYCDVTVQGFEGFRGMKAERQRAITLAESVEVGQ